MIGPFSPQPCTSVWTQEGERRTTAYYGAGWYHLPPGSSHGCLTTAGIRLKGVIQLISNY